MDAIQRQSIDQNLRKLAETASFSDIYAQDYTILFGNNFDMNTGKLIRHQMATSHSTRDENSNVPVKFQKNTGRIGGKLRPQDTDSTRLQELSLMNNTHLGATHYDIDLDMKLEHNKLKFLRNVFNKI